MSESKTARASAVRVIKEVHVETTEEAIKAIRDNRVAGLHIGDMSRVDKLLAAHDRLNAAAGALYYAAFWYADRPIDEVSLWQAIKDAAGLTEPGPKSRLAVDLLQYGTPNPNRKKGFNPEHDEITIEELKSESTND